MEIGTSSAEKSEHLLLDVVLEDAKIVRLESRDQAVIRISDGDVQKREIHIHVQELAGLEGDAGRILSHVIFFGVVLLGIVFFAFFLGLVLIGGRLCNGGEYSLQSKQTYNQQDTEGKSQNPRFAKS